MRGLPSDEMIRRLAADEFVTILDDQQFFQGMSFGEAVDNALRSISEYVEHAVERGQISDEHTVIWLCVYQIIDTTSRKEMISVLGWKP